MDTPVKTLYIPHYDVGISSIKTHNLAQKLKMLHTYAYAWTNILNW